ncbi:MAG: hypothetical protein LQ341_001572 [Variospora aurantia]|nr:MAG: hypothetical protein LQ341_001572 [Variospora aurantia]
MALLATILLSFLSTLVGIGSRWRLVLSERKATRNVPISDVVINYPHGAFVIVKCEEDVARSLYWAPEECKYYRSTRSYRLISLIGTLILMFGVICLGNATINVQLGYAASYIILNAAYWIVAALPQRWNWDLRCYDRVPEPYQGGEKNKSFTTALWKAIAISGTTKWVRVAGIAPVTDAWDMWLRKAAQVIKDEPCTLDDKTGLLKLPDWDPEEYLSTAHTEINAADSDRAQNTGGAMV